MTLTDILNAIGGEGNAANTAAALGLGTAGLALAEKGYSDIGDIGEQAKEALSGYTTESGEYVPGLADKLSGMLEFQPYTVTSATGGQFGMTRDPDTGQMSYQMATSPEEQALQQQQLERAGMFFGQAATPVDQREQEVYQRMRTAMSPEEERQRLELEQRMAAQGRTGVRTAQFGGTPEQLAMAKAQSEAQNQASLMAMQQSGVEQQQALQRAAGLQGLTSGMFGMGTQARMTPRQLQGVDLQNMQGMMAAGYVPQAQLLNALQPGMTTAERQRQALSEQAGAYGETYASGLDALLQSALAQANIAGGVGGQLGSAALGGLFK